VAEKKRKRPAIVKRLAGAILSGVALGYSLKALKNWRAS